VSRFVPWIVIFASGLVFTFFVDLGGNFFGLPDIAVNILFAANLTLFLWLLARFAGQPMVGFLQARRDGIGEQLRQAEARLREAEELRREIRDRLDRVEAEVGQLKERASTEGQAEAKEIAEQTVRDEERFLKRVESEIARRGTEVRQQLAKETAELTAQLTRDLLSRELTDNDRQRILKRNLETLQTTVNKE
jgi:ATP synthase F0 subunit b